MNIESDPEIVRDESDGITETILCQDGRLARSLLMGMLRIAGGTLYGRY
jgi:hypothetical protein